MKKLNDFMVKHWNLYTVISWVLDISGIAVIIWTNLFALGGLLFGCGMFLGIHRAHYVLKMKIAEQKEKEGKTIE